MAVRLVMVAGVGLWTTSAALAQESPATATVQVKKEEETGITTQGQGSAQRSTYRAYKITGSVEGDSFPSEAEAKQNIATKYALLNAAAKKLNVVLTKNDELDNYVSQGITGGGGFGGGGFGGARRSGDGSFNFATQQNEYKQMAFFVLSLETKVTGKEANADALTVVRALAAINGVQMQAHVRITKADADAARSEAVKNAVADAQRKARVLAQAAQAIRIQLVSLREMGTGELPLTTNFFLGGGDRAVEMMQKMQNFTQSAFVNVQARYNVIAPIEEIPKPSSARGF